MTESSEPGTPVDLGKHSGAPAGAGGGGQPEVPFDPYRFGRPDHPVPPEYAPPGYVPDPAPGPPGRSGSPPAYGGAPSYGSTPAYGPPPGGHNAYQQLPPPAPYNGQPYPVGYPGAPGPQPYGYGQPPAGRGKATAALVLGILSIVFSLFSIFDVVFVALAVVFGLLALGEARRGGRGRGMAVAGLACAVVGALLATVLTVKIVHSANQCGGLAHPGVSNSDFRQCFSDNF